MNILLTNDDGIGAPGIWAAARTLAGLGRVTVAAPAVNYSGFGAALPPTRSVSCVPYQRGDRHPAGVTAYSLAATPAGCAHTGLSGALGGGPFDLLVSGVNHGANLGRDVFYSGTVGAALTAHLLGVPAIAISLDAGPAGTVYWDAASWALREAVRLYQANPEPSPVILNVNVPNLPASQLKGTLVTSLTDTSCLTRYRFEPDPHLENVLNVTHQDDGRPAPKLWTDAWAIAAGYVAITPLRAIPDLLWVVDSVLPHNTTDLLAESTVSPLPSATDSVPLA
jgi:5'-nucleotidase